jgi:hypothetical protein
MQEAIAGLQPPLVLLDLVFSTNNRRLFGMGSFPSASLPTKSES